MEELLQEGWSLREGAQGTLLEICKEGDLSLREAALRSDLRKIGEPALPEHVSQTAGPLKGPHVLQIVQCIDVGHPSKGGVSGSSAKRLLCIKLTDGKASCKALEMRPLQGAEGDAVAPGAKVLLAGTSVKAGIVLVDSRSLKLLGGRVEELYNAWNFQRKFGGSTRTAAEPADAVDGEKPPQFKTFVPGKTRVPKRVTAPTELAPNSHSSSTAASMPVSAAPEPDVAAPPGFERPLQRQPQQSAHFRERPGRANSAHASRHKDADDGPSDRSGPGQRVLPAQPAQRAGVVAGLEEADARQLPSGSAAKAKLQEKLAAHQEAEGARGRGRGRGRGRRRRFHEEEEEAGITLEEWEAQQGAGAVGRGGSSMSDEALARQLQRQLDMEDATLAHEECAGQPVARSAEEDLRASLFAFDQPAEEGRGRSRGGLRRGGRGRGRQY